MCYTKIDKKRLFFETSVIVFGFVVGYSLRWVSFPSFLDEMIFTENFHEKTIFPDFMKSFWIIGINDGILCAVCLCTILQLFFRIHSSKCVFRDFNFLSIMI